MPVLTSAVGGTPSYSSSYYMILKRAVIVCLKTGNRRPLLIPSFNLSLDTLNTLDKGVISSTGLKISFSVLYVS
uniref:Uncharacterized protein n=1 Tax=Lepeophtheirus salmonis TaxID=72036 RepID=A0A0K2UJN3_LEPSM